MKICSNPDCKTPRDQAQFHATTKTAKCKACLAAQHAVYYAANKQKWKDRDARLCAEDLEAFRQRNRETQARYRFNPDNTIRPRYFKSKYGITLDDFARFFDLQEGKCAICKRKPDNGRYKCPVVDHDHKTDLVRGLLCHDCNVFLGLARDQVSVLLAAVDYLNAAAAVNFVAWVVAQAASQSSR